MQIDGRSLQRPSLAAWLSSLAGAPAFDALEARLALSTTHLPHLADMESPNDTVVRLETNFGDIDIELYNSAAPITVSNFLRYVNSGRLGDTFFHRSALNPSPFVLQGGGYQYSDAGGLVTVATDAPIVRETTGKHNLARTVAMARTGDITSATSQFFINYVNNTFLDPTAADNGYAVFAKVIQGWDVVLAIEALQSVDLTGSAAFAGPEASNFGEVPVGSSFSSSVGVRQADLVNLISAEVIKPASVAGFFAQRAVFPEGFRSGTSVETLDLFNPNSFAGAYQVTLHYELGQRDAVIASGSINPNAHLSIPLSDFSKPGLNLVRASVGYSIEVTSAFPEARTTSQPVAASINRFDYNASTGESFLNPATLVLDSAPKSWDLPRIERNISSREYIVYQNLSNTATTVTTVFHTAGGDVFVARPLGPYRRGGLEVFSLGLPEGVLWANVFADQDIAVALSDWDLPNPLNTTAVPQQGFLVMGVPWGRTVGGYAGAEILNDFTSNVSIVNSSSATATLNLNFASVGNVFVSSKHLVIPAGGRIDLDLDSADIGIPAREFFAMTYFGDSPFISAQYTMFSRTPGLKQDGIASPFGTSIPPIAYFADGEMDPTLGLGEQTETISIVNTFHGAFDFTYKVRYYFSDGTTIDGASGSLGVIAGRADIVSGNIALVRAKASSNPAFRRYGVAVIGEATNIIFPSSSMDVSYLTVLTRWDSASGESTSSSPMFSGPGVPLDLPFK